MIQFDAVTESNGDGSDPGTEPFNHTVANQPERVLFVAVCYDNAADLLVGATYNSVSMTELGRLTAGATRLAVFMLPAPATGTNAVNFSWSPSDATVFRACAVSFYNSYEVDPLGQTASATGENQIPTEFSTNITPDDESGIILDFYAGSRGQSGNAKTPQNEVINITGNWSGGVNFLLGSSYVAHSGSQVTMEWENLTHDSSAADQFHFLIEIREKPVAGVLGSTII